MAVVVVVVVVMKKSCPLIPPTQPYPIGNEHDDIILSLERTKKLSLITVKPISSIGLFAIRCREELLWSTLRAAIPWDEPAVGEREIDTRLLIEL